MRAWCFRETVIFAVTPVENSQRSSFSACSPSQQVRCHHLSLSFCCLVLVVLPFFLIRLLDGFSFIAWSSALLQPYHLFFVTLFCHLWFPFNYHSYLWIVCSFSIGTPQFHTVGAFIKLKYEWNYIIHEIYTYKTTTLINLK